MLLPLLKLIFISAVLYFLYYIFTCQSIIAISIVSSFLVSLVMMVLTFQYNLRKQSVRNYLDSLRKCQWMMKQNLMFVSMIVNQPGIELENIASKLKDLEPYLPDHFGFYDDLFREDLLQCQNYINQCRVNPQLLRDEFTQKLFESKLFNIEGQIKFINEFADKRFFVWYFLNPIFSLIKEKVIDEKPENENDSKIKT